jgi:predicted component of type VI protein secretion system
MPYLEINLSSDTLLVPFSGRIDYVIGRLPRSDIQLRDMKVSRVHTQLFTDSRGKAFVRDLGSSSGTILNGAKLQAGAIQPLTRDSRVRVGDARITFHEGPPPAGVPAVPSRSAPRAIIRTYSRVRPAPPVATKPVSPTETGPAEAPPDVNQADFVGDPNAPPSEPPPPPEASKDAISTGKVAAKRKDTGVLEAPWESTRAKAVPGEKRVTLPPTTRLQPPMPSAEIDETGRFHDPSEKPSSRANTKKPLPPLPPRVPLTPPPLGSSAAFVPPPPPAPPCASRIWWPRIVASSRAGPSKSRATSTIVRESTVEMN